ncbi:MAG: LysR substrate-binding domain-containing protein [Rhizobiaceae bacterium]|nr:LysR substrate-binding domain-containing protein [Rhizobiaceae bacterium]
MRHAQLRAFHHVAIQGGFSKAARALGLTQPAISDQVRKLEVEYDVRLFNRDKKQTSLTRAGDRLLEITYRLFEVEQLARELLSQTKTRQTGTLKIIADSAIHMLHILGAFRIHYPLIEVSLQVGNSQDVLEQLSAYHCDIGVLGELPRTKEFDAINLGATSLVAFTSKAQAKKLAPDGSMTMQQLASSQLVLREPGSKTRAKLERHARSMGIAISTQIVVEGREAVREIVAAGGGVAIVSRAEFTPDPRLVKIEISDADIQMEEALVCLHERRDSKLIRLFMNKAQQIMADKSKN